MAVFLCTNCGKEIYCNGYFNNLVPSGQTRSLRIFNIHEYLYTNRKINGLKRSFFYGHCIYHHHSNPRR
jgi:hypothetical protein